MKESEYKERLVELEADYKKLEKTIYELKNAEIEEENTTPPHPRPYPECNENYLYVNPMGEVDETNWTSDRFDLGVHKVGNVFMTEKAAEFAVERLRVLAEMKEWAGEYGDPVSIAYIEGEDKVDAIAALYPNRGEMVFASYEDADNCIKAIGADRIKKYYFGIDNDG